jgi:hypothetical protein
MSDYQKTTWQINLWGLLLMAKLSTGGWAFVFAVASTMALVIYILLTWRD